MTIAGLRGKKGQQLNPRVYNNYASYLFMGHDSNGALRQPDKEAISEATKT